MKCREDTGQNVQWRKDLVVINAKSDNAYDIISKKRIENGKTVTYSTMTKFEANEDDATTYACEIKQSSEVPYRARVHVFTRRCLLCLATLILLFKHERLYLKQSRRRLHAEDF